MTRVFFGGKDVKFVRPQAAQKCRHLRALVTILGKINTCGRGKVRTPSWKPVADIAAISEESKAKAFAEIAIFVPGGEPSTITDGHQTCDEQPDRLQCK